MILYGAAIHSLRGCAGEYIRECAEWANIANFNPILACLGRKIIYFPEHVPVEIGMHHNLS